MATATASDKGNSLSLDSDEVLEMYCEQCDKCVGISVTAKGFCVECVEYMCSTCLLYHKRYVPEHSQLNEDVMPQDFSFVKCSIHTNQLIKFYCSVCKSFACMECKTNKHGTCNKVDHLSTTVKGIEQSKELQELMDDIEQTSKELDTMKKQIDETTKYADTLESEANFVINKHGEDIKKEFHEHQESSIKDFDEKVREIIENLKKERREKVKHAAQREALLEATLKKAETDIKMEINSIQGANKAELQSLSHKFTALKTDLNNLQVDLDQKIKTLQRCKVFMKMKSASNIVEKMHQEMLFLESKMEIKPYRVEPKEFDSMMDRLENVNFYFVKINDVSERRKFVAFHSEINLHSVEITSMCLLFSKQLLVIDQKKESLLIFKDIKPEIFDEVKLPSKPSDIASLEQNVAAVTLPNLGILKILTFSQKRMSVIKKDDISVGRGCHGIASCQKKLLVSFFRPAKIQVMDLDGNVLITFQSDTVGMPLFSCPRYIAVSPDNTTVYVSDTYRNTVTSMKFDGAVKYIYKDKELIKPGKLIVDHCGSVFVCGHGSNNVHQLTSDLVKVEILFDKANGMKGPESIIYSQEEKKLYVGMSNKGIIKVFKIA